MGKKKGDDGWGVLIILLLAAAGVYYVQTGQGKENDAALIPNRVEGQIDQLVAALNSKFGTGWLDYGVNRLRTYIATTMPALLVLVDVVSTVEQLSRRSPMSGLTKKQMAVQKALTA